MTLNIFEEDWRACLRAHYFHVIKARDTNNETSLISVLIQTGFTEEDIAAMHAEVLAELGWTPDGPSVEPVEPVEAAVDESVEPAAISAPAEELAPAQPEPLAETAELESSARVDSTPPPDEHEKDEPPAPPVQMSLF